MAFRCQNPRGPLCVRQVGQDCRPLETKANAVTLRKNPDHATLLKALEPHSSKRVLHFADMRHAYGNFPSKEYRDR